MNRLVEWLGMVVFVLLMAALVLVVSTQGLVEENARPFGATISDKMMEGEWHE